MKVFLASSHLLLAALSASARHQQRDYAGPAPPAASPAWTAGSGAAAVQTQLKGDVSAVTAAFASAVDLNSPANHNAGTPTSLSSQKTAELMSAVAQTLNSYQLNQNLNVGPAAIQARLDSMASAVGKAMDSIGDVAASLEQDTHGAVQYDDLKQCITGLVKQGGLHDGESCTTANGMSISGVSNIMSSVLTNYATVLPPNILDLATSALDPAFTPIIPAQAQFKATIDNAFESVQASVSGSLVTALESAKKCFHDSMTQTTYSTASEYVKACERNPQDPNSVYTQMKTLYLSVVNQFVGYISPNIIESAHAIANQYLGLYDDTKTNANDDSLSDPEYFRKAIYNTTLSVVATNVGEKDTAYELAKCMDTLVGASDTQGAAHQAAAADCLTAPRATAWTSADVVRSYVGQIYGVLPAKIGERILASGVASLSPTDPDYGAKVAAYHSQFAALAVGPAYATCYNQFLDCMFNARYGALEQRDPTTQTCFLGEACQVSPDGQAAGNPFGARKRAARPVTVLAKREQGRERRSGYLFAALQAVAAAGRAAPAKRADVAHHLRRHVSPENHLSHLRARVIQNREI